PVFSALRRYSSVAPLAAWMVQRSTAEWAFRHRGNNQPARPFHVGRRSNRAFSASSCRRWLALEQPAITRTSRAWLSARRSAFGAAVAAGNGLQQRSEAGSVLFCVAGSPERGLGSKEGCIRRLATVRQQRRHSELLHPGPSCR